MIAYVHRSIAHLCSFATSAAVATGAGNTLGNKGAVAVYLKFGATKILIVNAHLAAHQNAEQQRNNDFQKINKTLPVLLERKEAQFMDDSKRATQRGKPRVVSSRSLANNSTINSPEKVNVGSDDVSSEGDTRNQEGPASGKKPRRRSDNRLEKRRESDLARERGDSYDLSGIGEGGVQGSSDDEEEEEEEPVNTFDGDLSAKHVPPFPYTGKGEHGSKDIEAASETSSNAALDDGKILSPRFFSSSNFSLAKGTASSAGGATKSMDEKTIDQCADAVIFMGDLNYRIKGNR